MVRATIGVLPGDYIGPEITREALKVLDAINRKYGWDIRTVHLEASGEAYDKYGKHLPDHTLEKAATCDALLKGPFGGPPEELHHPKWSGVEQGAILPLRKHFDLFMNLRETKVYPSLIQHSPIKEDIVADTNILIVRELTSGIYFGKKEERIVDNEREYSDVEAYRESEIRRIALRAFEIARNRRKKVTLVAKSNVLKSSVLWREVVQEVAKDFPDVVLDYMHVDNAAMQLILNPRQFDVILTNNMFGDILSDEASVLSGSIGLLPSASLGSSTFGLYEPIHGSAPSIAGKNIANPISAILCIALMLRYTFDKEQQAQEIENAVEKVLEQGYRTADLVQGRPDVQVVGTDRMGDLITKQILGS
ncbi:MAG: 3-isopropylmalate dehydrogenase [Thermobacillus sp. ZCTH02-B1]|uniref:3-isopropylmalate dehydrogenase n=1 Tax=Thermobacillus sp. ZCTH02-B1 TaxID=1858795 RepID=UPI000B57D2FE|nr:3-isopropylmalate dehydrogenase [Thermobacillus sp. ZCTH02-B1]OUM94999.1 MAG: 3-isopropylmalate dehydrogenase [Thermobacillus sp. ZCTH02-B1]